MPVPESPCDFHCGYAGPADQKFWEHVFHEHRRCPDCGNEPFDRHTAVRHNPDCPRLRPGYVYPGPVPAEFDDSDGGEECE